MRNVDLRKADRALLRSLSVEMEISLENLRTAHIPVLQEMGFGGLRKLSARFVRTSDLTFLSAFQNLEVLEVWQSGEVSSLSGIHKLTKLRWLGLSELGPLCSLEPLASLFTLEELILTGGVWKDQRLAGGFEPLASLQNLRRLTIGYVRGPTSLSPLLDYPKLDHLSLATSVFPLKEVARLAARYPFWRKQQPWFLTFDDRDCCARCGSTRKILLLRRTKRLWRERCDEEKYTRTLDKFEQLIDSVNVRQP